jgi:hypothetical protein
MTTNPNSPNHALQRTGSAVAELGVVRRRYALTDKPTMRTFLLLLLTASILVAAEPSREAGLSVHMLPDRVAKISREHGGFTVTEPATKAKGATYAEPKELFTYFQGLPAATQQNGIWIVTTHPTSYSEAEQAKLKALITLCGDKSIPIYTCRGSELPNGWKRAK